MATFAGSFVAIALLSRLPLPGGPPTAKALIDSGALLAVAHLSGRRWGAAVFFLVAAAAAIWVAASTRNPVLAFGAVFGLQAALWAGAEAIAATGRMTGGTSIYAILAWIGIIQVLRADGSGIAAGALPASAGAVDLAVVVPLVGAILGALALPNSRWPLPGRIPARSALDLVLLALTAGLFVATPFRWLASWAGFPPSIATALVASAAVAAVLSAYARVRVPGPRERRLLPPLVFLPGLAIGALILGFVRG
jgi:hypothetical protein